MPTAPECIELCRAVDLAVGDEIERVLHVAGEVIVDELAEVLLQQPDDGERGEARDERRALLPDVAAIDDRGHDRGVGGRTADAELLKLRHKLGLGVAGRRGRGVALRGEGDRGDRHALEHHRELTLAVVVVLGDILQGGIEARKHGDGAGGAEFDIASIPRDCAELHRGRRHLGIDHLRGHRALPDQVVEGELIGIQLT